jgi:hypothetical protein
VTEYIYNPYGSQIIGEVNPQSSREELTKLSTNVFPTRTQMSGFLKNGEVDLEKCLDEVNRRASEIGEVTTGTAREAITVLQG